MKKHRVTVYVGVAFLLLIPIFVCSFFLSNRYIQEIGGSAVFGKIENGIYTLKSVKDHALFSVDSGVYYSVLAVEIVLIGVSLLTAMLQAPGKQQYHYAIA